MYPYKADELAGYFFVPIFVIIYLFLWKSSKYYRHILHLNFKPSTLKLAESENACPVSSPISFKAFFSP